MTQGHPFKLIISFTIPMILQNYLRGINYVAVPTASSIIELVVKIAIAFGFSYLFGYNGIWWAWPIAWIVTDIFLFGYYFFKAVPELKKITEE